MLKYFSPDSISKEDLEKISFIKVLLVSGITYGLFFLQTGLDQIRVGNKTFIEAIILASKGLGIGTIGLIAISIIIFVIIKAFNSETSLSNLIKVCCLSYTTALISLILGLILNIILHFNTAIAFGVTGVLWSLNPLFRVIRKNTKGNLSLSLILCTSIGLLILFTWHTLI